MSTKGDKQYDDLKYSRYNIDKSEVIEIVKEVLGITESNVLPMVFDGKITPVVVLNDTKNYTNWVYKNHVHLTVADSIYDIVVDNWGNVYLAFSSDCVHAYDVDGNLTYDGSVVGRYSALKVNQKLGPPYMDNITFSKSGKYVLVFVDSESGVSGDHIIVLSEGVWLWQQVIKNKDSTYNGWVGGMSISPNGKYIVLSYKDNVDANINQYMMFVGE